MPTLPPPSRNAPAEPMLGYRAGTGHVRAVVHADGSVEFDDERDGFWAGADPIIGLAALSQFDLTDRAMRAARQDPYRVEKMIIMDATRGERMEMRRLHDEIVMQRAIDDLPNYLAAVWSQRRWSPGLRRRILFALWDEAAEDGNEFLRAAGAEARFLIEEFIARRLPPGSRYAFGDGELAELNRRRQSRASFAPYAASLERRLADAEAARERAILAAIRDEAPILVAALRAL